MKKGLCIGLIVLLFVLLFVGCQKFITKKTVDDGLEKKTSETETQSTTKESTNKDETPVENTISDEEKAKLFPVNFELSDGRGNSVNLDNHEGKLLFLNFFTTWCGYCMEEMPGFQKTYDTYKDDIEIIIVNVNFDSGEKSIEEVVAWYEDGGYTFPMVIDEDGVKTSEFYPYIQGYPTTFIYGPDGSFLGYLSGALDEETMQQIIEKYKAN